MLPPVLAPNLYCPARPPAPWHIGIAPNQHPIRFIRPTLVDTLLTSAPFFGKRSQESAHTAITEFRIVRGI